MRCAGQSRNFCSAFGCHDDEGVSGPLDHERTAWMVQPERAATASGPTCQLPLSGKPPERPLISRPLPHGGGFHPHRRPPLFPRTHHAARRPSTTMASPSIPAAVRHPHLPAGGILLSHPSGDPTSRSALSFRQKFLSHRLVPFLSPHLVSAAAAPRHVPFCCVGRPGGG